ncbi:uncharacterized protein LOC111107293 [Crassostrea virginica]
MDVAALGFVIFGIFTVLHVPQIQCKENTTYEVGKDCSLPENTKYVTTNSTFLIEFNGSNVSSSCNRLNFMSGDSTWRENTVCFTPLYFNDPECSLRLEYSSTVYDLYKSDLTQTPM